MSVLGSSAIRVRAAELFAGGTFKDDCLRPAAYDLRLGKILKVSSGVSSDDDCSLMEVIDLRPGAVAVVETYEKLKLPADLTANVGVKFRLANRGLFISGGLLVDPTFGAGADLGASLRFQITNLGEQPLVLRVGEAGTRILGMQFLTVEGADSDFPIVDAGVKPSLSSMSFFGQVAALEHETLEIQQRIRDMGIQVEHAERATERVVVFGVFLVAFAVFGASLSFILAEIAGGGAAVGARALVVSLRDGGYWVPIIGSCLVVIALACLSWLAKSARALIAPGKNASTAPSKNASTAPGKNASTAPGKNASTAPGKNASTVTRE